MISELNYDAKSSIVG